MLLWPLDQPEMRWSTARESQGPPEEEYSTTAARECRCRPAHLSIGPSPRPEAVVGDP
jgi:hypothetical protein